MNNRNRFSGESRAQGGQVKSMIFDQQSRNHLLQKSAVKMFLLLVTGNHSSIINPERLQIAQENATKQTMFNGVTDKMI